MSEDEYIDRSEMEFMFGMLQVQGMSTPHYHKNMTKCMSDHIGEEYISDQQFALHFRQCDEKYFEKAPSFLRKLRDDSGISDARLKALLDPTYAS